MKWVLALMKSLNEAGIINAQCTGKLSRQLRIVSLEYRLRNRRIFNVDSSAVSRMLDDGERLAAEMKIEIN